MDNTLYNTVTVLEIKLGSRLNTSTRIYQYLHYTEEQFWMEVPVFLSELVIFSNLHFISTK